jgi:hypothetical protein
MRYGTWFSGLILGSLFLAGCDSASGPAPAPAAPASTAAAAPAPAPPPGAAPPPAAAPPETELVVAAPGVSGKGNLGPGILTTPINVYFRAPERITFEAAIPHAMNLFNASEGRFPNSHDEFMQRIITENNIDLPRLPDGHRYLYDPQTRQLMVERPTLAAAP